MKKESVNKEMMTTVIGRPIVFLDIDGVINTLVYSRESDTINFSTTREIPNNPVAVGFLNYLYTQVKFDVVVSSSWRLMGKFEEDPNNFIETLREAGLREEVNILGVTPYLYDKKRGDEIQKWIDDNHFEGRFAILDDDSDMEHLLPYLVKTECEIGITFRNILKVEELLKGENINYD